jgi:hypothetical protein
MQLILARKTVEGSASEHLQTAGSCLMKKEALQVIALVFICVAISV